MTAKPTTHIDGLTRLAAVIASHFNIPCVKQDISKWQKFNPPFPSPVAGSNRYKVEECLKWVEVHWLPKKRPDEDQRELFVKSARAKAEREIDRAARERFELDKEKELYVDRATAAQTTVAVIKRYHSFVKTELEANAVADRREKLQQLGISAEHVATFYEWDLIRARAMVDRIEKQCQRESKE